MRISQCTIQLALCMMISTVISNPSLDLFTENKWLSVATTSQSSSDNVKFIPLPTRDEFKEMKKLGEIELRNNGLSEDLESWSVEMRDFIFAKQSAPTNSGMRKAKKVVDLAKGLSYGFLQYLLQHKQVLGDQADLTKGWTWIKSYLNQWKDLQKFSLTPQEGFKPNFEQELTLQELFDTFVKHDTSNILPVNILNTLIKRWYREAGSSPLS